MAIKYCVPVTETSIVVTLKKALEAVGKEGQKTREKTREKILRLIKENPEIITAEVAEKSGVTTKGVEWNLKKLKAEGRIRRIGSDKGGYWEVISDI